MLIPVQTVSKIPKNPQNPIKNVPQIVGCRSFLAGTVRHSRATEWADQKRQTGRKNCRREKPGQLAEFVKYHPKINFTYVTVLEMANTL